MNCSMCQKPTEAAKLTDFAFYGNSHAICPECRKALDDAYCFRKDKRQPAIEYINNLLSQNDYPPDISVELKKTIGEKASKQEYNEARQWIKRHKEENKHEIETVHANQASGNGFLGCGVLFFILAIVLFVFSINTVDEDVAKLIGTKAIANIPLTVFSAASFVSGVICFCCAGLIKYFRRK